MNQFRILVASLFVYSTSFSQVIGGRENSETTPKTAEATQLTGGGFVGDVNVMTGEFQASIPLGSVSTPAGLGFSLALNHSSSFAFSYDQPMTAGIPYGDGWSLGLPTVSIETDVFSKYGCDILYDGGATGQDTLLNFQDSSDVYSGSDEGDLYWFSPMINIPGVVSGRAIFKYVDVDDNKCLVFVLNKFETSVELRYYGDSWTVKLADGTVYSFTVHLAHYRAPSNQRILFYDQSSLPGLNINKDVAVFDTYSTHAPAVQNVIEPKQTYSVWHCQLIYNQNTPLQVVRFEYEKFGKFNYFEEFNQARYQGVRIHKFNTSANTDFSAYSDIFLKSVSSYVMETPLDVVELDYRTNQNLVDNNTILNHHSNSDVFRKDSLYSYTVVKEWGDSTLNFNNWQRVKHQGIGNNAVNSTNPYLSSSNMYSRENGPNDDEMPFSHGFLESPRIFNGQNIHPGDVYEIRSTISRPSGTDFENGNGTLDIAITTGTLGNTPSDETNHYAVPGSNQTKQAFTDQNGVEIFSTFNSAMKWQMGYGQSVLNTSNFFIMPNMPSTYDGMNIQIGPGNSDMDFNASMADYNYQVAPLVSNNVPDAMVTYPFNSTQRQITSTAQIPHNFGTGYPWGMMIPVYNQMALSNLSLTTPQPDPSVLYKSWWALPGENRIGVPTKFNDDVKLEKVQLIRYSKNAYMLSGVRVYKVNGDYAKHSSDSIVGRELVAQKRLEYTVPQNSIGTVRNYDYSNGDLLHGEIYQRRVIQLTSVREIPVDVANMYAPNYGVPLSDTSKILTTFLGYRKILDNEDLLYSVPYEDTKPYKGITQFLLYSYTDHLGGITKADYYPFGGNGESRVSNNYKFNPCQTNITRRPIGQKNSYTAHAAVQYLAKNDENDLVRTNNYLDSSSANMKVWTYQYNVAKKIYNPKQMKLGTSHFRSHHLFRNEHAFGEVRVLSPKLATGERTYIDYVYYGNIPDSIFSVPSEEEFLLYGKLKSMKTYDQNDVLHDEKIINYDYTLAFENAYLRPNLMREKLGFDSYYTRSYEYEDVYKDELLHAYNVLYNYDSTGQIIDSTVTLNEFGEAAYKHLDVPYLRGTFDDNEQPKFMEFWFYNDLVSQNADYLFNSYFIKKTSEINRVYDDYLGKNGTVSLPAAPPIDSKPANPFGTGVINTTPDDPATDDPLMLTINQSNSFNALSALLANSPLSDTVLMHAISSTMRQEHIATALAAQSGLSNTVWNHFIDKKRKFSTESYMKLIDAQPYFSDPIQSYLIEKLTTRDNYAFPKALLLKNEYLSNQIVLEMTDAANLFPEEVFSDVIGEQSYLPESTVIALVNSEHTNENTLVNVLSDQVLTDEVWDHILMEEMYEPHLLTDLIEATSAFPSDAVLLNLLDYSHPFEAEEIQRIFGIINRPLNDEVEAKLLANYPEVGEEIVSNIFIGNPLSQFCNNAVINGRTYIETRTDYEYYEADHTGKAIGIAHEMLLGHRSHADAPSPYPFTQSFTTTTGSNLTQTVSDLRLKHEPSWQVYSIETSSPHHPNAYNREEYYYLYDLQNRYDRYWYNYDLASGNYEVTDYDPLNGFFSLDTIGYNINWTSDYTDPSYPILPQFDGMERTRTYGNRVLAFQKSVISKNSRDDAPLIRSEYYNYDRRWVFNDLPSTIETISYPGDSCSNTPPGGSGGPCTSLFDCTDCYRFKYVTEEQMQAIVPLGHCAYLSYTYGWFICPYGTDVSAYAPDASVQYCNIGVSSNNSPPVNPLVVAVPKALPVSEALSKTLLLRSVTVQVDTLDHSINQVFAGAKMDGKNQYVAEFQLGNYADVDTNNFNAPYEMIYPYDHLTVRTILERNRYLQPALEENQIGLQTKYYYNSSKSHWNVNSNCNNPAYNPVYSYMSHLNEDIGKPVRITVGYNKTDSLSSTYGYNEISIANKVTSPSGKFMEYTFDDYFRLTQTTENGSRVLSDIEYSNWLKDESLVFDDRTKENYVATITYNDDPVLDPLNLNQERRKAFIDPLGRNHSVASGYSLDEFKHIEIHSGTVEYDNWGRITKAYKNFTELIPTSVPGAPKIALSENIINPFAKTVFENDPKGRALRTSNYGVDVTGIHAVKSSFAITNNIFASCELDLNLTELELILGEGYTNNYRLMRSEIFDQDNKQSVEYVNALGQKVASLKYNNSNERIVTLFVYDSYGNLTQVINPEKQETHYEYNILGQLVKETTEDAGTKRYMYNKQGLVSITLDEQGQFYDPNGDGVPGIPADGNTDAFYRVYEYDDYGRMIRVGRAAPPTYSLNQEFTPLHYQTTLIGNGPGIPEGGNTTNVDARYFNYTYTNASSQDWLASFDGWTEMQVGNTGNTAGQVVVIDQLDQQFYIATKEKETFYGGDVTSNEIGKLVLANSYNNDGMKIQKTEYTYDNFDNLATQITEFNAEVSVDVGGTNNIKSIIEYPSYNYRNSLKEQRVDVDGDLVVDYHCFMEYDALNRLKAIYGAAGLVASSANATLLVSYEYDDANGLVDKKKHYIDDDSGLSVLANEIDYNYDTRDRLTEIRAGLPASDTMMHYQLFYDDDNPMYQYGNTLESVTNTLNWNGNINGTTMRYGVGMANSNITNPISDYDKPLLYGYSYDKINRLVSADATVGNLCPNKQLLRDCKMDKTIQPILMFTVHKLFSRLNRSVSFEPNY